MSQGRGWNPVLRASWRSLDAPALAHPEHAQNPVRCPEQLSSRSAPQTAEWVVLAQGSAEIPLPQEQLALYTPQSCLRSTEEGGMPLEVRCTRPTKPEVIIEVNLGGQSACPACARTWVPSSAPGGQGRGTSGVPGMWLSHCEHHLKLTWLAKGTECLAITRIISSTECFAKKQTEYTRKGKTSWQASEPETSQPTLLCCQDYTSLSHLSLSQLAHCTSQIGSLFLHYFSLFIHIRQPLKIILDILLSPDN